jgi:uncharacterized protein YdeI (YjbR/CyaY-like superfamily)
MVADVEPRNVIFFSSPAELRDWLAGNGDLESELWVGLYRKASGRQSLTWAQVVDQALCFGWIDGIRKRIDADSFTNRLTPRRRGSTWSAVNIRRFGELRAEGLVLPAGLRAFEARDPAKSALYSYEQRNPELDPASLARLRSNDAAWQFWQAQPTSYRRPATWWIVSAKKDETRQRRLETLIEDSAAGRRIGPLRRPGT